MGAVGGGGQQQQQQKFTQTRHSLDRPVKISGEAK